MNIEEDGKTYIKIKDRQEKSIIEKNKVLENLSKLEPLENEEYSIEEELEEVMKENKQLKDFLGLLEVNIRINHDDIQINLYKKLLQIFKDLKDILGEKENEEILEATYKIEKLHFVDNVSDLTLEELIHNINFTGREITNKINEIIEVLNER